MPQLRHWQGLAKQGAGEDTEWTHSATETETTPPGKGTTPWEDWGGEDTEQRADGDTSKTDAVWG